MSESVLKGMCDIVGTEDYVAIRRKIIDNFESRNGSFKFDGQPISTILSGSRREGFRFENSDIDIMCGLEYLKVVWYTFQQQSYNPLKTALLIFDGLDSPPGYGVLYFTGHDFVLPFLREEILVHLDNATICRNGKLYLSSSKTKRVVCSFAPFYNEHGPCASGSVGSIEIDNAWCFTSNFWPPAASEFANRRTVWPKDHVLNDIINTGCHLVPIGNKLGQHEEDEWRISFSVAEQKLMYSMNHCEFVLYGLLKIFLKEVLNNVSGEEYKLLCSYHMKTALFWVLQNSTIPECCPQNFLQYFWACFKLVLKWVYEGVCPNFFIPENNMFLSNIYGSAQRRLFDRLHKMYENGLLCLLESPSINPYLLPALTKQMPMVIPDEILLIRELFCDETYLTLPIIGFLKNGLGPLEGVQELEKLELSPIQRIVVEKLTNTTLKHTVFALFSESDINRVRYIKHKIACHVLKSSLRFCDVSDLLLYAMFYHKMSMYDKTSSILEKAKDRLGHSYLMHKELVERELHNSAVRVHYGSESVIKSCVSFVRLYNLVPYIKELEIERLKMLQYPFGILEIPPLVFLHMLEFLCYRHLDMERAMDALDDLYVLVHNGPSQFIFPSYEEISWHILGVCQEISGNLLDALISYKKSFDFPDLDHFNRLQNANKKRMSDVLQKMKSNGNI